MFQEYKTQLPLKIKIQSHKIDPNKQKHTQQSNIHNTNTYSNSRQHIKQLPLLYNDTPPFIPIYNNYNRQIYGEQDAEIWQMQNLNKQTCYRDMGDMGEIDEWEQVCYTQELRTHFYRAKRELKDHFQQEIVEERVKKHRRGISMDLNQINKKKSINQKVGIHKIKKQKGSSQSQTLKAAKKSKKSSQFSKKVICDQVDPKAKSKLKLKLPIKKQSKELIKIETDRLHKNNKSKHSKWYSQLLEPRQNATNLSNYRKKDKNKKQGKSAYGEQAVNTDKFVRLANNSKVTSLKSMDYSHLESTESGVNVQLPELYNFSLQKNNNEGYFSIQTQLLPTKQQEQQAYKISKDIDKFSKKKHHQIQNTEDNGDTEKLISKYLDKINQWKSQSRLQIEKIGNMRQISSQESIDLDFINDSNSEVVQKVQVSNPKPKLLQKIQNLLQEINNLQSQPPIHQNPSQSSLLSSNPSIKFKYQSDINFPTFVHKLEANSELVEQNFIQELLQLQAKYSNGRINQQEFDREISNLNKWHELETRNIRNAKKMLERGLKMAMNVIESEDSKVNHKNHEKINNSGNRYGKDDKYLKKKMKNNAYGMNLNLCKSMSYLKQQPNIIFNSIKGKIKDKDKKNLSQKEQKRPQQFQKQQQQQRKIKLLQVTQDNITKKQKKGDDEQQIQTPIKKFREDNQFNDQQTDEIQKDEEKQRTLEIYAQLRHQQIFQTIVSIQESNSSNQQQSQICPITSKLDGSPPQKLLPSPPKLELDLKPKYHKLQDKEDIIEFLFMDMCLELQEYYFRNIVPTRNYSQINDNNSHLLLRTRLRDAIYHRKKGFNTNRKQLLVVLQKFNQYLSGQYCDTGQTRAEYQIERTKQYFQKTISRNMNIAVGPTPKELLKFMRIYNEEQGEGNANDSGIQEKDEDMVTYVFQIEWFDQFSKYYISHFDFGRFYVDEEKEKKRITYLKNAMHIHNKAIFDNLNQAADKYRKYGIFGEPFPWKVHPLINSSSSGCSITNKNYKQILRKIFKQVQDNSIFLCGIFHDKQFSYNISEYEASQLKEDRLCKMLAKDLVQNEPRWLFYDDEETEILVDLAEWMYGLVIEEAIQEIFG